MSTRDDPSAIRWLIGVELTRYRNDAGLSLKQMSEACGIGKPKLSHMEAGRYVQYPEDIAKILAVAGAGRPEIDRLSSIAGQTHLNSWWAPWSNVLPDWVKTFAGLEGIAAAEFVFEPIVIPGLLQTDEYATATVSASGFVRADHVERIVAFRKARAQRLFTDEPLRLHAIMEEGALRRRVGDAKVMRDQYEHLLQMSDRENIDLQIVRPEDGIHTATGQFVVLDFIHARPIAYAELRDGAVYIQDPDSISASRLVVDNLRQVALSCDASRKFVEDLIKEL